MLRLMKDDNDCAFGENCVKKVCRPGECIEDKDCGLDGKCLDTVCIYRCKINEDCPKGKECRDGNCGEPQGEECRRDSGKGSFIQIRPTKTADSIVLYQVIRFLRDGSSKTTSLIYTKIL